MADNTTSPGLRRGLQLPLLQTNFDNKSSLRLHRPRPIETVLFEKAANIAATPELVHPLARRQSKTALLGMFGRTKSIMANIKPNKLDMYREQEDTQQKNVVRKISRTLRQTHENIFTEGIRASSTYSNVPMAALQHRNSKSRLITRFDRKEAQVKPLKSWDPPGLFKAYPQAIRHVRLRAPSLPTEVVLLLHEERIDTELDQRSTISNANADVNGSLNFKERWRRDKDKKSKYLTPEVMSTHKWTEKIYVLATSGYLLQYSGSGNYDRLPEKIMPLEKSSVAFASDAIAGEHYVLQIAQSTNEEGEVTAQTSKSKFRKLGLLFESRKTTSNFLLVFDTPEDMNEWLVVVRKEIESLGGKKYQPDVLVRKETDDNIEQVQGKPSRRYLVKRDTHRFEDPVSDAVHGHAGFTSEQPGVGGQDVSTVLWRRPSLGTQRSIESPSVSNTTASPDQANLDQLRGTPRLSYVSVGEKTLSTTGELSPDPSPARAAFSPEDLIPKPTDGENVTDRVPEYHPAAVQTILTPDSSHVQHITTRREPGSPRAISMYNSSFDQPSTLSTSNSGVPNFSKRYSCASGTTFVPTTRSTSARDSRSPSTLVDTYEESRQHKTSLEDWPDGSKTFSNKSGLVCAKPSNQDLSINSPPDLSSTVDPSPNYSHSDLSFGRRFSSLEHSSRHSCTRLVVSQSPSPHPPPTNALPALPEFKYQVQRRSSESATKHCGAKRPVNLQAHSESVPRTKYLPPAFTLKGPSEIDEDLLLSTPTVTPKPSRAPHLPPTVHLPELTAWESESTHYSRPQSPCKLLPDLSLPPEISFLIESASGTQGFCLGPRSSADTGERRSIHNVSVR